MRAHLAAFTLCVAVVLTLFASAASARDLPPGGMTIDEIVSWLQDGGYGAEIRTESSGERNVYSSANGNNFHIYLYDCKAARCGSFQFSAGYDTKGTHNAAEMNTWNLNNRWVRAYVDQVNDPWVRYDIDLTPGGTYELLNDEFAIWRTALANFRKAINF
jgi:hypothetical protein